MVIINMVLIFFLWKIVIILVCFYFLFEKFMNMFFNFILEIKTRKKKKIEKSKRKIVNYFP